MDNNNIFLNFVLNLFQILLKADVLSQFVGLSCVDTVSTLISVCEFKDDDSFSNLEALLVTLAPKECLLIQGDANPEFNALKQVCNLLIN